MKTNVLFTILNFDNEIVKEKRQQLYEMFEKNSCWKKIRAYLQYRKFCNLFVLVNSGLLRYGGVPNNKYMSQIVFV